MYPHQYPQYYYTEPMYNYGRKPIMWNSPIEVKQVNRVHSFRSLNANGNNMITDYGPKPFVVNINEATKQNNTYRTALWTGEHLQVTLMSINPGEDIGLEIHPNVDQFLRIEKGQGLVQMGKSKNNLNFERMAYDDSAIMIPAGTWHNVTNTGNIPLKLYSIYAPPNHPFGTVHVTKADAMAAEDNHGHNGNTVISGKTPDEWIQYTEFLVNEGLEDVKRGINATHILQEFILMGVLVGKGYSPEKAYETVEEWERTGESKLLQQSKNMPRTSNTNRAKTSFSREEAAAIALLLGIDFSKTEFGLDEFWMGVNTELEHGRRYNLTNVTADDPITTGKIALAHLTEFPDYYQRLKVLEEEAKAHWNK